MWKQYGVCPQHSVWAVADGSTGGNSFPYPHRLGIVAISENIASNKHSTKLHGSPVG